MGSNPILRTRPLLLPVSARAKDYIAYRTSGAMDWDLLVLAAYVAVGGAMTRSAAVFLFVGIFGAFTTMSTFTLETVALFEDGRTVRAFGNAVLNGGGCLAGAFAGRFLALLI
jgi:fluoride ion exporter CrcB/FEX